MGLRTFASNLLAATQLPTAPPPKVPNKQQALPGYRTQRVASSAAIRKTDRGLANTDLLSFRTAQGTSEVIRQLVASSPDMSSVVSTYLRVGIPEDFTVLGYNMDGSISPEATALAHQVLRRWTFVPDYTLGFNPQASLQSLSETLGKELVQEGALAGEVVLDKARLPMLLSPISVRTIKFYEEDFGVRPVQDVGGVETNLDIPTFIYISVDQDQQTPYASSYIEAAIQPILADADFTNDLRRVLKRAVHPRVVAKLIEEKLRKTVGPEILNDPNLYAATLNSMLDGVQTVLNGLAPEDAIAGLDSVEYGYMEGAPPDMAGVFTAVQEILNSKTSTGAKTMPAVLGHKSNDAVSETMLYLKHADLVRRKLNEFYSRALTLSIRLFGIDGYVTFTYAKLDLRPDSELEAYKAMFQSRVLEQLSLGLLTDEAACVMLTGQLPPTGMAPLSGTMFKTGSLAGAAPIENPQSGTSTMNKTKPNTPASPKSPKGATVIPIDGTMP